MIFFFTVLHDILREDHALELRAVSTPGGNFTETREISRLFDIYTYKKVQAHSCVLLFSFRELCRLDSRYYKVLHA